MITYKLHIKFLSDTCVALGQSGGSSSDMDIYRDIEGYPYIPAKRIKGLIRDACKEYNLIAIDKIDIDYLFGKQSSVNSGNYFANPGALYFQDAIIKYKNDDCNFYIASRTQTAIDEDGQAKAGSLRTINVCTKGTDFFSQVSFDGEKEEEIVKLKDAISLIHHMGLNRNRGYGLVSFKLTYDDNYSSKKTSKEFSKNTECIKIMITNEAPLMVSTTIANKSLDYIPSSTIFGFYANEFFKKNGNQKEFDELFLNDNCLHFTNAYISDDKFNEYIPSPAFLMKYKNRNDEGEVEYLNMFYKENISQSDKKSASLKGKYIRKDKLDINGIDLNNLNPIEPEFEYGYHNSLNSDGSIKDFFQYYALAKNQNFVAYMYGDSDKLCKLIKTLDSNICYFGKSRNSQYGRCIVSYEEQKMPKYINGNTILFTSNTVIKDEYGNNVTDLNSLKRMISNDKDELDNYSLKFTNLGGYNMLWHLPKIAETAIEAGSYIDFDSLDQIKFKAMLDSNKLSVFDIMVLNKSNLKTNNEPCEKVTVIKTDTKTQAELIKEAAFNDSLNDNRFNGLNSTQIERLILTIRQLKKDTNFYNSLKENVDKMTDSNSENKNNCKKVISLLEQYKDNNENAKLYISTLLDLLKYSKRRMEL